MPRKWRLNIGKRAKALGWVRLFKYRSIYSLAGSVLNLQNRNRTPIVREILHTIEANELTIYTFYVEVLG